MQVDWDDNEEFYKAWDEGRTGYPWIDAIMKQLHQHGWLHHLARHATVSLSLCLQGRLAGLNNKCCICCQDGRLGPRLRPLLGNSCMLALGGTWQRGSDCQVESGRPLAP